jgi:outer membrane protein assembly factor BamD
MTQSSTRNIQLRSFLPTLSLFTEVRSAIIAGVAVAALIASPTVMCAQSADGSQQPAATAPAQAPDATLSNTPAAKPSKKKEKKEEKTVQSKDTKKLIKKTERVNKLEGVDAKLPDKALYDKAEDAIKHGRYDVGRLDLQTLLNTYPESQYMMHAKLAIADSWYREGGTAALTQAEQEYKDFITFFPNAPEAAEAQMRVGDIYFKQMDKPDRDYTKTVQAEQEYRLMLQQFPDSVLVPQARQRLREVQEVLASREADIASFYATRSNWGASIARYQTVVDTYPLYSHMDDVLVALGDAYEAEAKYFRALPRPTGVSEDVKAKLEQGKARLEKIYDDQAAAAYRKVILEHSAAPHVEDARDRLVGMGLPVPTPTPEQVAASTALENSRGQYTLSKRATLLFMHQADTVPAATVGQPPLEDAKPTLAPAVVNKAKTEYEDAMSGKVPESAAPAGSATPAAAENAPATAAPAATAPLSFQDVPAANTPTSGAAPVVTNEPNSTPAATSGTNSIGAEIVQPNSSTPAPPATAPATPPAFPGSTAPQANPAVPPPDPMGGISAGAPSTPAPLAPVEKPAKAPDAINEVTPGSQPAAAQAPPANGKKPKPTYDKNEESSSKHKKKKGLGKLNPF